MIYIFNYFKTTHNTTDNLRGQHAEHSQDEAREQEDLPLDRHASAQKCSLMKLFNLNFS